MKKFIFSNICNNCGLHDKNVLAYQLAFLYFYHTIFVAVFQCSLLLIFSLFMYIIFFVKRSEKNDGFR